MVPGPGFLREVLEEVVELVDKPGLAGAAHVVEQLVHEDERRLLGEHLPDHVAGRGDALLVVLGDHGERLLAAELPGDLAPGGPSGEALRSPAAVDDVELGPDEDRDVRLGDLATWARLRMVSTPATPRLLSPAGEVVEGGERVRLAAAELRRHVEDGRGLDLDAREPPHDLPERSRRLLVMYVRSKNRSGFT